MRPVVVSMNSPLASTVPIAKVPLLTKVVPPATFATPVSVTLLPVTPVVVNMVLAAKTEPHTSTEPVARVAVPVTLMAVPPEAAMPVPCSTVPDDMMELLPRNEP